MCPLGTVFRWLCELNSLEYKRYRDEQTERDSLARFSSRYRETQPAVNWLNPRLITFEKVKMAAPHLRLMIAKLVANELFENADQVCNQLERGEEIFKGHLVLRNPLQKNEALDELFRVLDNLE